LVDRSAAQRGTNFLAERRWQMLKKLWSVLLAGVAWALNKVLPEDVQEMVA